MNRFSVEVERLRAHLVEQGYHPGDCVELFTRGQQDETLVVHFAKNAPVIPGDEEYYYFDTPSTIVVMLNMQTGKVSIPELF